MKIGFIGGGHMAGGIIGGLYRGGGDGVEVEVAERNPKRRAALAAAYPVRVGETLPEKHFDAIIIAVRPADVPAACGQLPEECLAVSIAAGIRLSALRLCCPRHARLIRAMPNTPVQIGEGVVGCYADNTATEADVQCAEAVFSGGGLVAWVGEEHLLDVITAVSGSGPAYAYYLIEAMREAGIGMGLPPEIAGAAARQTVRGAAGMVGKDGGDAAALRKGVMTPGGTTEAAVNMLDRQGVGDSIIRAVIAAGARAKSIGDGGEK